MVDEKEKETALGGLTSGSATAIWKLMFYVVAESIHTLELLMDSHSSDVNDTIESIIPHRPKWYADKALAFMQGMALETDTDTYDTSGMTDDEVNAAKVVKHAVAIENDSSSLLTIKVAGEDSSNNKTPLPAETETQLLSYLKEIKDAGVRIMLVNKTADKFNCNADIYYNPQLDPDDVKSSCETAIKNYIQNLPFNGEYTNMALEDALQRVDGVKVVSFNTASCQEEGTSAFSTINARRQPAAGYFSVGTVSLNMIAYE